MMLGPVCRLCRSCRGARSARCGTKGQKHVAQVFVCNARLIHSCQGASECAFGLSAVMVGASCGDVSVFSVFFLRFACAIFSQICAQMRELTFVM